MRFQVLTIGFAVAVIQTAGWHLANPALPVPSIPAIEAVAYTPRIGPGALDAERVDGELGALRDAGVRKLRLYASGDGASTLLPALAAKHELRLIAAAWIGRSAAEDRAEIEGLVAMARHPQVEALLVGNETLLRGDRTAADLVPLLREVRRRTGKPVSTAEPWATWIANPALAAEADYLAIHILPYWEPELRRSADALPFAEAALAKVRAAYPDQRVVVTEVGWPSDGQTIRTIAPSRGRQAAMLRGFGEIAAREDVEWFAMEAIDRPWKEAIEGPAGAHWGILGVDLQPKFALDGPVYLDPSWRLQMGSSVTLCLLLAWASSRRRARTMTGHLLAIGAGNAVAAGATLAIAEVLDRHWSLSGSIEAGFALAFLVALTTVALAEIKDAADSLGQPLDIPPPDGPTSDRVVSIHLAISREPPDLVIAALHALARLRHPLDRLEVVVIDNNTTDEALWRPVERECAHLNRWLGAAVFVFRHVEGLNGFKGGALAVALATMRPDAEIVGVIDADYVARPGWLAACLPAFADPRVATMQAPQANRDRGASALRRAMNEEYDTFFRTGMIARLADNAVILHGTMLLIRVAALASVGGWPRDSITEDAALGVRLQGAGWRCAYTTELHGTGISPFSFAEYARQRARWAFGGVSLLPRILSPRARLNPTQRLAYLAGWMPWIGDALGYALAHAAIVWTLWLAATDHAVLPHFLVGGFAVAVMVGRIAKHAGLHLVRVRHGVLPAVAAGAAGGALSTAAGRAVLRALMGRAMPFRRTAKAASSSADAGWSDRGLTLGLVAAATTALLYRGGWSWSPDAYAWAAMLAAQALGPGAACLFTLLSATAAPRRPGPSAALASSR